MSKHDDLLGKTFEVRCPFIQQPYSEFDEDGPSVSLSWKPGVEWIVTGPEGEADARAHGMGSVKYHVIDVHDLPRPYPSRVFFTRRWVPPTGREFGAKKLWIMTVEAFRRRLASYKPAGFDFYTQLIVEPLSDDERKALLS